MTDVIARINEVLCLNHGYCTYLCPVGATVWTDVGSVGTVWTCVRLVCTVWTYVHEVAQ